MKADSGPEPLMVRSTAGRSGMSSSVATRPPAGSLALTSIFNWFSAGA